MKKLSVFLLATVFIFGLAVQADAQDQGPHQVFMDAFSVDDTVITFDDVADPGGCTLIANQYIDEYGVSFAGDGVSFSEGLFGDPYYSSSVISPLAAGNFNICEIFSGNGTDVQPFKPISVTFDEPVTRVGFLGFTLDGTITVTPIRDGDPDSGTWVLSVDTVYGETGPLFIGIEDLGGIDAIVIEGTGAAFVGNEVWIDDLTFGGTLDTGSTDIPVTMNVRPPNCSGASINMKSKGVIPVVIAGKQDFDVTMIDPTTIMLNGVAPVRSALEDVPYCSNLYPDGVLDLTLKFDTQKLVDAMEASALAEGVTLENDDLPFLHLTGNLFDGTTIYADEPVRVTGKPAKENRGSGKMHLRQNKGRHKGWHNNRGHHKGWKNHHGWD